VLDKESFTLEELLEEDDCDSGVQIPEQPPGELVRASREAQIAPRDASRARVPASRSSFVFARQLEPAVSENVSFVRRVVRRVDRARRSTRTA
jgi:hypothetical protein